MTLVVMLELSPEVEAKLRDGIARHDVKRVHELLTNAITPTVTALLEEKSAREDISDEEWEVFADQFVEKLAARIGFDAPMLTDYAVSRAGIYEDHP